VVGGGVDGVGELLEGAESGVLQEYTEGGVGDAGR
jgi:hypothetical protein